MWGCRVLELSAVELYAFLLHKMPRHTDFILVLTGSLPPDQIILPHTCRAVHTPRLFWGSLLTFGDISRRDVWDIQSRRTSVSHSRGQWVEKLYIKLTSTPTRKMHGNKWAVMFISFETHLSVLVQKGSILSLKRKNVCFSFWCELSL